MKRLRDLKTSAIAYGFATLLGGAGLAFLALAGYLGLATVLPPAAAALSVGLVLLLLAVLAAAAARGSSGRGRRRGKDRSDDNPMDALEHELGERVDPVLGDWVRRHPERAALATVLLGVAAGYSESTRGVLQDMYRRYVDAESERRGRRR